MAQYKEGEKEALMATELWTAVLKIPESSAMVRRLGLSVRSELRDPEMYLWIDADQVITGEAAKKDAVIVLKMSWGVFHDIYSGNLGLTPAISSGKMKVRGPLLTLLKLVPLLGEAQKIWPGVCKKHNVKI